MSDIFAHPTLLISAAMLDGLWEGLLIAGLVWLGLQLLPKLGAATRYMVWLLTLAALVAIPLLTVAFPKAQATRPATVTFVALTGAAVPQTGAPFAPTAQRSVVKLPPLPVPSLFDRIAVLAAIPIGATLLWVLVACARIALLVLNLVALARMRRRATPWSAVHDYPVFLSSDIDVPLAVGFLRPCVMLPTSLIEQQSSAAVEAIIVHEVAHLHRGDVWSNAAARVLEALVALNPAAWFVLRRLSVEREIACDDWVVARLGGGDIFARALATMASCAGVRVPLAAPSAIGSKHSVVARIEQLLDAHPRRLRLSLSALGGTLMLFAMIAIVLQTITPVLAYAPEQKPLEVASTCSNHGVLEDMRYYGHSAVVDKWQPLATVAMYEDAVKRDPHARELRVATADVAFDATGKITNVTLVSTPNLSDIGGRVKRQLSQHAYRPAVVNCRAVASTVRTVVVVGFPTAARTQSNVAPSYPVGWGAQHASACRVPNLVHDGVPTMQDFASLPALTASVRVNVDSGGSVTNVAIVRSSGRAEFDDALLAAARAATYPLDESTGFKPVRPSGAALNWNDTHGYSMYSKCTPLPTAYVWSAVHTTAGTWVTP